MRLLFVQQNFPGQYRHLLRHYQALPGFEVACIGESGKTFVGKESQESDYTAMKYLALVVQRCIHISRESKSMCDAARQQPGHILK